MRQTKSIIADDERQLRISLRAKLAELWPELIICGEAKNGLEAIELIENNSPDIAFLDIRMPGLSGIEVAEKVAGTCRVIFITAYDQYAIEAFENEALDYILKPVTKKRFEKTVKRIQKQINSSPESLLSTSETVERVIESLRDNISPGYLQWIKAQYGDGIRLIPVDEVYYFKASDKYTLVITKERELLIKKSIKELAEELDPNKFWRIHRGTIVNVSCIAKTSRSLTGRSLIKLKDRPEVLTVSRTYAHLLKQM